MCNTSYTMITGASEGFGKALAIECARRKMNLILVALPGPELHSVTNFIKRNYPVDVITIEKDLCKDEGCIEVYNKITALNVEVNMLINNAGIGSTAFFEEGTINFYEKQIKLNVLATTLITRLFLEMLKRNKHSYILNVGSMASFFYLPKKQVYGATKSFIYSFFKSLRKELRKDKVHVSVLCPGGMNTNLPLTLMNKTGSWLSRLSVMNPEEVVPIAIDGLLKRKEVIIPGRLNKFFMFLDTVLPEAIKKIITGHGMKKLNSNNSYSRYLSPEPVMIPVSREYSQFINQLFSYKITVMNSPTFDSTQKAKNFSQAECYAVFLLLLSPVIYSITRLENENRLVFHLFLFFTGFIIYTFFEYISHRFWMHGKEKTQPGKSLERHMNHHRHPTELKITAGLRTQLLVANFMLLALAFEVNNYFTLFTGFYTGFVYYCFMHVFLHKPWAQKVFSVYKFRIFIIIANTLTAVLAPA